MEKQLSEITLGRLRHTPGTPGILPLDIIGMHGLRKRALPLSSAGKVHRCAEFIASPLPQIPSCRG